MKNEISLDFFTISQRLAEINFFRLSVLHICQLMYLFTYRIKCSKDKESKKKKMKRLPNVSYRMNSKCNNFYSKKKKKKTANASMDLLLRNLKSFIIFMVVLFNLQDI